MMTSRKLGKLDKPVKLVQTRLTKIAKKRLEDQARESGRSEASYLRILLYAALGLASDGNTVLSTSGEKSP